MDSVERQMLLLNLTLMVGIFAVAYFLYQGYNNEEDPPNYKNEIIAVSDKDSKAPETAYNAEEARRKFPNWGKTPLFQAIMTPTPTPTPTPPPPEPTPDIHAALQNWALMGISDGVVSIENEAEKDPDKQFVDIGKTQVVTLYVKDSKGADVPKKLRIVKLAEYAENPYVVFSLEGSGDEHTIKQFEETAEQPQ